MTKYQNKYRNDEQELEEAIKQHEEQTKARQTLPPTPDPEEETFKKRYGDLRRHAQKTEDELKNKINELNNKLKELSHRLDEEKRKKENKFPVTQEEFEEWAQEYPKTVKMLQTMIRKENEATEQELEKMKKERKAQEAWAKVLKVHKDGAEIIQTDEFKEWVVTKPKWVNTAVYSDEYDSEAFIDVLTLYKNETRDTKKDKEDEEKETRRKEEEARREAASTVSRPKSPTPEDASGGSKKVWKESEISKLHGRQLEKLWPEIEQAMKEGRIEHDISGGAR